MKMKKQAWILRKDYKDNTPGAFKFALEEKEK